MIPQQLTLRNFLSYREASLDFRGIHVACICGSNGAGKSSLLEAIAWVIWGQSRVAVEDDIIHIGASEVQVDFRFEHNQQIYRVIRRRRRNQTSSLEFQIKTSQGFSALTQRGMRATQQLILEHLKLDYDTFINSAYLRQGRADEFMLKRPNERKQILADLLKLNHYDLLAERAKEKARQAKAQVDLLEHNLQILAEQLRQRCAIAQEYSDLETELSQMQQQQQRDQAELSRLQEGRHQHRGRRQQLTIQQQQHTHFQQTCQRLEQELDQTKQRQQRLEGILEKAEVIAAGRRQLQQLQAEEERQTTKFQTYQAVHEKLAGLQQQLAVALSTFKDQQRQAQSQLEMLRQQTQENQHLLNQAADVEAALAQSRQAQSRLNHFNHLQLRVTPLLQRRRQIQSQIERAQARLSARLEELGNSEQQLQTQQAQQPQLMQAVMEVSHALEYLEQRQIYQEKVRDKGLERRSFMERLQAHQRDFEVQLGQLDHKIRLLSEPNAVCPICDRSLDEHHWRLVLERHQSQHQEIQAQIWVIREQLAVSEKEIQVLRQEYRQLEDELATYGPVLEKRGSLQAQIYSNANARDRLQRLEQERTQLERCLQENLYAEDLHQELQAIDHRLAELSYDDRDHALVRGQVDRLRWAEIKQTEIQQARQRQTRLSEQRADLEAKITDLDSQIANLAQSPLKQAITQLEQQIAEIGYSLEQHTALREALQQAQSWRLRYQELDEAKQAFPLVQQQLQTLTQTWRERWAEQQAIAADIAELQRHLQQTPDYQIEIESLEQSLQQHQHWRDQKLARLGALQQQLQQLDQLQQQYDTQQQELQTARQRSRIYRELTHAFGRNGIQALMIENLLPQLEAETNQILARLSANQLHVQFVTQRAGRSRNAKLIDTLDILIADAQGTRPYETYSGGEAFRVNFAIRLALARILAQRSGMALQMLIVDEGFGTQDKEGCDRLIAAINAISSDFACILTVTHMPHFREAFSNPNRRAEDRRGLSDLFISLRLGNRG